MIIVLSDGAANRGNFAIPGLVAKIKSIANGVPFSMECYPIGFIEQRMLDALTFEFSGAGPREISKEEPNSLLNELIGSILLCRQKSPRVCLSISPDPSTGIVMDRLHTCEPLLASLVGLDANTVRKVTRGDLIQFTLQDVLSKHILFSIRLPPTGSTPAFAEGDVIAFLKLDYEVHGESRTLCCPLLYSLSHLDTMNLSGKRQLQLFCVQEMARIASLQLAPDQAEAEKQAFIARKDSKFQYWVQSLQHDTDGQNAPLYVFQ
eukprot:TRINITY_DN942_c0_g2_i1.p1 TRINITY_DN942_c0_g2~~TRINITY_DN942_c0_g2_i1.p1  ORF type:complete len:263 (-),score=77.77 TRINITY_DN942_c0_g2_i1:89-877(-)